MPQPSFGALLLAGVGLFLFFAATNVQSGWLFALDSLLWAVWGWDLVIASRRLPNIRINRLVPALVAAEDPLDIVVTLQPDGPLRGVEVVETGLFRGNDRIKGTDVSLGYVREAPAGKPLSRQGTLTAPGRGRYRFARLTLIKYGPLGLFRRQHNVTAESLLWVHPRLEAWDGGLSQLSAEGNASGSSRKLGTVGVFAGVRDYRPGDSLRQIHWPLTARRGTLSVKELEPPPAMRLTIVLALQGNGAVTEAAVTAAGDLAAYAWAEGIPLTLVGPGRAWEPAHWGEALEWFAEVEAGPLAELPADPGAIVLVFDQSPPTGWQLPLAAAVGPAAIAVGGVVARAWPQRVKATLSV